MNIDNIIEKMKDGFEDPFMTKELSDFITQSSKYIRSKSVLLFLKTLGLNLNQKQCDELFTLLATGEIIHNASLLHDDVLDKAELRRGEKTFNVKYNSNLSILAGDYVLTFAMEKLISIDNKEIFIIFKNCVKSMIQGEFKQYFLRGKIPTESEYIEICKLKTASLFIAMAESCAVLLNISKDEIINFFELFGIYFQIKNDVNDNLNIDKKNGINTAIDILGIEKTNILLDNYRCKMSVILDRLPDNSNKKDLRSLFDS